MHHNKVPSVCLIDVCYSLMLKMRHNPSDVHFLCYRHYVKHA